MWALIQNDSVIETTSIDPEGRFHESMFWLSCETHVEVGWLLVNGGLVAPMTVNVPAPVSCTPAQGLVALYALKQITEDHVLDAIGKIPDPVQQYTARIGYQRATIWERGSPTMLAMAQLLQLSDEDLDALFSYAVTVQV